MYTEEHLKKTIAAVKKAEKRPTQPLMAKTGLSRTTVQRFLRQDTIRQTNLDKLFEACLEIISEHKKQHKKLTHKYHYVMQHQKQLFS